MKSKIVLPALLLLFTATLIPVQSEDFRFTKDIDLTEYMREVKTVNEVYPRQGNGDVYPRQVDEVTPRQVNSSNASCTCGQQILSSENKIVGGNPAGAFERPWDVALYMRVFVFRYNFFCGASVISERWILTAAHCVEAYKALSFIFFPLAIVAGAHNLSSSNENSTRQIRGVYVTNMYVHPKYSSVTNNYDIALLELKTPLTINEYVSPACLPFSLKANNQNFTTEQVHAAGWGITGEKKTDSGKVKMETTLDLISNEECQQLYNSNRTTGSRSVKIEKEMICTYTYNETEESASDTCQGDSGGGIDYTHPENYLRYLIGVVSFGEGCARKNRPGVYARTTELLDFITKTTKNDPSICQK